MPKVAIVKECNQSLSAFNVLYVNEHLNAFILGHKKTFDRIRHDHLIELLFRKNLDFKYLMKIIIYYDCKSKKNGTLTRNNEKINNVMCDRIASTLLCYSTTTQKRYFKKH